MGTGACVGTRYGTGTSACTGTSTRTVAKVDRRHAWKLAASMLDCLERMREWAPSCLAMDAVKEQNELTDRRQTKSPKPNKQTDGLGIC